MYIAVFRPAKISSRDSRIHGGENQFGPRRGRPAYSGGDVISVSRDIVAYGRQSVNFKNDEEFETGSSVINSLKT